jgi:hypothetical protein
MVDHSIAIVEQFWGRVGMTEQSGLIPIGQAARLMELDPKYVDVIVTRWQDYSGKKAVLDGEDRTFKDIGATRLGEVASEKDAA